MILEVYDISLRNRGLWTARTGAGFSRRTVALEQAGKGENCEKEEEVVRNCKGPQP